MYDKRQTNFEEWSAAFCGLHHVGRSGVRIIVGCGRHCSKEKKEKGEDEGPGAPEEEEEERAARREGRGRKTPRWEQYTVGIIALVAHHNTFPPGNPCGVSPHAFIPCLGLTDELKLV